MAQLTNERAVNNDDQRQRMTKPRWDDWRKYAMMRINK